MTLTIRPANVSDLDQLVELLLADAQDRRTTRPGLWKLDSDAHHRTYSAIKTAMEAEKPPFRQQWLIAERQGEPVGVTHSILLPIPPIYAGEFGSPGLIMEGCFVAKRAPAETRHKLLKAAEADLMEAGAVILLASSVENGPWESEYAKHGYEPLTMYFAKTNLTKAKTFANVRLANADDVPAIVASSAIHRRILDDIKKRFWKPHEDADHRFGAWMMRSLTLDDRDMFVSEQDEKVRGYAISQPATALHFPAPHDISDIGVIDDFYHDAFEDPQELGMSGPEASALCAAAEAARERRGDHAVLVVCPAAWQSKIALLERQGYSNAITWHFKIAN